MSRLSEPDYDALVLRFFNNQDLRSVGQALGVSDDTAQKRVSRALDKLREHLARRGIGATCAALSMALSANAVQTAPAGLAASVAGAALTSAALSGTASSTLIRILTMTKTKASIVGAVALVTIAILLVAQRQAQGNLAQDRLRQENESLREQLRQTQELVRQQGRSAVEIGELERLREAQSELPGLRGEVERLRQQLQAATADTNQSVQTIVGDNGPTNLVSGFTRLQASVHSRVASGQMLVMGGWPGHPGLRVFFAVIPRITGENADQVNLTFQEMMELPEKFLADIGLDGMRTESGLSTFSTVLSDDQVNAVYKTLSSSSTLSTVLSDDQVKALGDVLHKTMDENQKAGADAPGKHMHCFGDGFSCPCYVHWCNPRFSLTNGQTTTLNWLVASCGNGGYIFPWKGGDNMIIAASPPKELWGRLGYPEHDKPGDSEGFDLGPYSGPPFTVTPVILSDGNSIDLTLQATLFWHFGDTP
jgi:hypothetical protein